MELIIETHLTRQQRMLLLTQAIEEVEKYGFGNVNITIHNHQITDLDSKKDGRFGNCSQEWYDRKC